MFVLTELLRTGETGLAFLSSIGVALVIQLAVQSIDSFPAVKRAVGILNFFPRVSIER
jgi:hypothetical protein